MNGEFDQSITFFAEFYAKLSDTLSEEEHSKTNKSKNELVFKMASQILIRVQKYTKNKKLKELPAWFKCIANAIKLNNNPNISLIAIESMIEILSSVTIDPIYEVLKNLII